MEEANDLLPPDIVKWMMEQLRLYRLSGGDGFLRINIQNGYIHTYGEYKGRKHTRPKKPC
jgi:hypothetical protein